jgi:hypothetical protein
VLEAPHSTKGRYPLSAFYNRAVADRAKQDYDNALRIRVQPIKFDYGKPLRGRLGVIACASSWNCYWMLAPNVFGQ